MSRTTLIDWLRAQDDEMLAGLLSARPDLATPPPAETAVVVVRAGTSGSAARACEGLDTLSLAVLEAMILLRADLDAVTVDAIVPMIGNGVTVDRVKAAVKGLRRLILVWGEDHDLRLASGVSNALGPFPGGLGQSKPVLAEVDLPEVINDLSEPERRMVVSLAHGPPIGRTKDAGFTGSLERAETPVQKLLAKGLLLHRDPDTVELPREIGLALRDSPLGPVAVGEPPLRTSAHKAVTVDSTGAGEAAEMSRHVENLLNRWSEEPPSVLKAGGLGVRDLRRLTRDLDVDETQAGLIAELALGAGLVADSAATAPEWLPTAQADVWLAATPANRWATLAAAWLDLPRLPGLGGRRDARDRLLVPLADELRRPHAPADRARVLGALADLAGGEGVSDPEDLVAVLAWRAPRRGGRLRDDIIRWTLREATALGVVALGALTSAGRALLDEGTSAAAKRMAEAMPQPVDHVLVQADLTVVAPGPLEPELATAMAQVADVESAGGATVYRIGEPSVRRALDAGRSADDLHELFRTHSRTPVPQSLTYMIDDVARRHGRLRGGTAGSFLRCDDPALVAEVAASAVAHRLELRRIAPTVLVSPLPLIEVLDELRDNGFSPAAEGPDGQVIDVRPRGRRLASRAKIAAPAPRPPSQERVAELVAKVRAGDRASASRRGRSVRLAAGDADTSGTLALLQEAVQQGRSAWIGVVDAHGVASQRILEPIRVGGGILEGRDSETDEIHRFPLHRITSAALVEE
ncbi:XPB/Ssl2-like helicase family protein [Herbihabitans rhizosphaerae]|uniref:XPB/Ssl2-like helicase family protein n=1 Tax=Herbihabitans rhizosphaerae TaxID=1872711 RepID=A0A4Q7KWH8_9PSEU|nr:helicase-associated domain-containing protein [Herbihabitans rhizosphaerae]RZS41017.1 XPB/Ssl2-like helicase family protein [Herbihabitans rhizosphaerae]